ncbi:MAG: sulfatase-like hydrolase/transferase [Oscillospiraceae bacterium]|nr:sulfatase-like hydrolase/transferase [Oscillospiraceae bacterium]
MGKDNKDNKKRPNIIFYFSDQQRHDTVGAYSKYAKFLNITPNLDKMAEMGIKFEYAFTPQPVCGPARACIQTSRFATQNGCFTNGRALKENDNTIAKYLNDAGYDTAYVGKWHLASNNALSREDKNYSDYGTKAIPENLRGGYKYWRAADILEFTSHGYGGYIYDGDMNKIEFKDYRCDCITDFALEYIENKNKAARDENRPFFMFISHIEPHHQNDMERFEGPRGSFDKFKNFHLPADLKNAHETEPDFDEHFANYLGCCNSLDYNLGRIIAELKRRNILDDTVIIYTSDHACHFRTRNSEYKRSCHENSIRIPMVIYGSAFKGGLVNQNLVSLMDLPPTILDVAGVNIPEDFMGKSLLNLLNSDEPQEWEDEIFTQISESQVARCIRTPKWKYSVSSPENPWTTAGADTYYEEFLYDLESDPNEQKNLIAAWEFEDERKNLSQILIKHMNRAGEKTPVILHKQ